MHNLEIDQRSYNKLFMVAKSRTERNIVNKNLTLKKNIFQGSRKTMEDADVSFVLPKNIDVSLLADSVSTSLQQLNNETLKKIPDIRDGLIRPGSCANLVFVNPNLEGACIDVGDSYTVAFVYDAISKKVTPHLLNTVHSAGLASEKQRAPHDSLETIVFIYYKQAGFDKITAKKIDLREVRGFVKKLKNDGLSDEYIDKNFIEFDSGKYWLSDEFADVFANEKHFFGIASSVSQRIGGLGTSRSISSYKYHDGVSSESEVRRFDLKEFSKEGDRIFIASMCDGFFEISFMKIEAYAKIIEFSINTGNEARMADVISEFAFSGHPNLPKGSSDNLSLLLTEVSRSIDCTYLQGIFDGHGNEKVSGYLAEHFKDRVLYRVCEVQSGILASIASIMNPISNTTAATTALRNVYCDDDSTAVDLDDLPKGLVADVVAAESKKRKI